MKRFLLFALLTFSILMFPSPVLAADTGNGTIEGQLVNGTAGGQSVADQEIRLTIKLKNTDNGTKSARTDSDGKFSFTDLPTSSDYSFSTIVTYQEADYEDEPFSFSSGQTTKTITIQVYDATMSNEALRVTNAHSVIYVGQGSLKINEFYDIVNDSDKTYIGTGELTTTNKRKTLQFTLPSQKKDLEYGSDVMSCCVVNTKNGIADTMPVFPGTKQFVFGYSVPYKDTSYNFSQTFSLPVGTYDLLVQNAQIDISTGTIVEVDPVEIEGNQFNRVTGDNLAAGDTIGVDVSGLPKPSNTKGPLYAGIAVVVLASGAGLNYLVRRKKVQAVSIPRGNAVQIKERLMLDIARLDEDYERGYISEAEYRKLRSSKKARLIQIVKHRGIS